MHSWTKTIKLNEKEIENNTYYFYEFIVTKNRKE